MPSSPAFKLTGHKKVRDALKRLAKNNPDRVSDALKVEAEVILTDSKKNYVPVDLGTLRSSGQVNEPERKGKDVSVSISYGGAASEYALAVHEHPSEYSPPTWKNEGTTVTFSPEGRGPKYLEKPLNAAIPDLPKRLAKRLEIKDPDV